MISLLYFPMEKYANFYGEVQRHSLKCDIFSENQTLMLGRMLLSIQCPFCIFGFSFFKIIMFYVCSCKNSPKLIRVLGLEDLGQSTFGQLLLPRLITYHKFGVFPFHKV